MGAIEGPFANSMYSWTSLLGQKEDTIFYEVYDSPDGSGALKQKQITTLRDVIKETG